MNNINITEKVLSPSDRFKLKLNAMRNKYKFLLGKKRMRGRIPPQSILSARARKIFRKNIEKRIRKDKNKSQLSYAERQSLEKLVDKLLKNPSIQQKMINWTKPGGLIYTQTYNKVIKKMRDRSNK